MSAPNDPKLDDAPPTTETLASAAAAAPAIGARVTAGVAWSLASAVVNRGVAILAQLVLAGRLDAADYALLTAVIAVTSITNALRDGGVGQTLVNRSTEYDRWANAGVWMSATLGAASCALTLAAIPVASRWFGRGDMALPLAVAAATMFATSLNVVPAARLQRDFRFRAIARVSVVLNALNYATTIALAIAGAGALAILVPNLVNALLQATISWRLSGQRVNVRDAELAKWPSIVREGGWFVATTSVAYLAFQTDFLLLNRYWPDVGAGAYGFAQLVSTQAAQIIVFAANGVLFPALASLRGEAARQRDGFLRACRLLSVVAIPACLGQALAFPPLLELLYRGKWRDAAPMVEIFSCAMAFVVFGGLTISLMQSRGELRRAFAWNCGASLGFLTAVLAGLAWGPLGVAIAVGSFYAIAGPLGLAFALRFERGTLGHVAAIFLRPTLATVPALIVGAIARHQLGASGGGPLAQLLVTAVAFAVLAIPGVTLACRAEVAELRGIVAERLGPRFARLLGR